MQQHARDVDSEKEMHQLQFQLASANLSLSNSVATGKSMQEELQRLRAQGEMDVSQLASSLISLNARGQDDRFVMLGIFAQFTGREKLAEKNFRKAIQINPKCSPAYNNLGTMLKARGDTNAAYRLYELAYTSNTNNAAAAINHAFALTKVGRHKEAYALISKAEDLSDCYDEGLVSVIDYLIQFKDKRESFRFLKAYVETAESPKITKVIQWLSTSWSTLSDEQKSTAKNWIDYFSGDSRRAFQGWVDNQR